MTDCSFTMSSRTISSIMKTADSLSILIVKSTVILSKSVRTLRNAASALLLNMIIMIAYSKTVSSHIVVSTAISNIQLDLLSAKFAKNS